MEWSALFACLLLSCWKSPHILKGQECQTLRQCCCYPRHISGQISSASGCYLQHILRCRIPLPRCRRGLLSTAQFIPERMGQHLQGFCTQGCYSAHNLPNMHPLHLSYHRCFTMVFLRLLSQAHFYGLPQHHPPTARCSNGCYSQHSSLRTRLSAADLVRRKSMPPWSYDSIVCSASNIGQVHYCYSAHNSQKIAHWVSFRDSPPKYFFLQNVLSITTIPSYCYSRHISIHQTSALQNLRLPVGVVIQCTICGRSLRLGPNGVVIPRILLL